jgi:hypothetical protein
MKDTRSTIAQVNHDEIIEAAGGSVKAATLTGQQQYSTPTEWAEIFTGLLPDRYPAIALDPQCAGANLLRPFAWNTIKAGFDIDRRFEEDETASNLTRITGNCVKIWEILDDLFPDIKFDCQVANPPFGLRWNDEDSTEYTWRKIMERASSKGFGYFIANHKTMERVGITKHPWVYLYQIFPKDFFPKTEVEPGVVHWCVDPGVRAESGAVIVRYETLDRYAHDTELRAVRQRFYSYTGDNLDTEELKHALASVGAVLKEESRPQSAHNIWLDRAGMLQMYLSTRSTIKRKLSREEIMRLYGVKGCHPLALTTDAQTRKLLRELLDSGFYTMEEAARVAIASALAEVEELACPIMPVTDFERVAYADELDYLECAGAGESPCV